VPGPQGRLGPGQWKKVEQVLSNTLGWTPAPRALHRQSSLVHPLTEVCAAAPKLQTPLQMTVGGGSDGLLSIALSIPIPMAVPATVEAMNLPADAAVAATFAAVAAFTPAGVRGQCAVHIPSDTHCIVIIDQSHGTKAIYIANKQSRADGGVNDR